MLRIELSRRDEQLAQARLGLGRVEGLVQNLLYLPSVEGGDPTISKNAFGVLDEVAAMSKTLNLGGGMGS